MGRKMSEIRAILKPLSEKAAGIYLYGSYAEGNEHAKSDIDVCVVAGKRINEFYRETNLIMAKHPEFDIKLFEELPIYLKKTVMEKGILLYLKDEGELSLYLRFYKKLWNEQALVRLGYAKAMA